MRFKPVWAQPTDVFYERFQFYNYNHNNADVLKRRKNFSLALKSGFLFKNSGALMAIIVVNF